MITPSPRMLTWAMSTLFCSVNLLPCSLISTMMSCQIHPIFTLKPHLEAHVVSSDSQCWITRKSPLPKSNVCSAVHSHKQKEIIWCDGAEVFMCICISLQKKIYVTIYVCATTCKLMKQQRLWAAVASHLRQKREKCKVAPNFIYK